MVLSLSVHAVMLQGLHIPYHTTLLTQVGQGYTQWTTASLHLRLWSIAMVVSAPAVQGAQLLGN
jgi:hypothetical protein